MRQKFSPCYRSGDEDTRTIVHKKCNECKLLFYMMLEQVTIHDKIDPARSLKAEIMVQYKVLVAYSIQVYQFFTTKTKSEIHNICEANKVDYTATTYPKLHRVNNHRDYVSGSFVIQKGSSANREYFNYDFVIRPSANMLILQGPSLARSEANDFLAQLIQNAPRFDVIKQHIFSNEQMLKIFKNITDQHNRNIIMKLKLLFNPELGYEYDRETYTELEYQFVENRCASKHRDFKKLLLHSDRLEITFGLLKCVGIVSELANRHIKLVAKPDGSFRAFKDIPYDEWDRFIMEILNFI